MDIRQLRYFVEVLEAGSLRKAADHLHIAQTALGRQVRLLEEEFGKELINRHPRGISPTAAGQRLQHYALELLALVDEIHRNMVADEQSLKGLGTIGAPSAVAQLLFGPLAARLAAEQPDIGISFVEGNGYEIWSGLEAEEIDLAILIEPEVRDDFDYEDLLTEPMFLVARADDPDAPGEQVAIPDLAKLPVAAFPRGSDARKIFARAMARANAVPNIAFELRHPSLTLDFVARSLAYGLLSASQLALVRPDDSFRCTPVKGLSFNRTLVRHKKSRNRAIEDVLISFIRDEYAKMSDSLAWPNVA